MPFRRLAAAALVVALTTGCATTAFDAPVTTPTSASPSAPWSTSVATPTQLRPTPIALTTSARPSTSAAASNARPGENPGNLPVAELQKRLDEVRTKGGAPGAIVGVWGPRGSWVGTSGLAGPGGAPITRDHHTRIASVSKTFVTTVLLQLADEGKVRLDQWISDYVPGTPNPNATLEQLTNMTSGIVTPDELEAFNKEVAANPAKQWTNAELLGWIGRGGALFSPGAGYNYSNANTMLLGMVIEKVTGKPLATVVRERICEPLKLTQTSMPTDAAIPAPYLSGISDRGVMGSPPVNVASWSPSYMGAAGGMVSTVDDLHTWADALYGGATLSPQMAALRRASLDKPSPAAVSTYGLGYGRDHGWVGHSGELDGYTTMMRKDSKTGTVVVVIVNSSVYVDFDRPASVLFNQIAPLVV